MRFTFLLFCFIAAVNCASSSSEPTVTSIVDSSSTYDWTDGWQQEFPIHKSCNDTQFNQLAKALQETKELAAHARDHTVRFGNESKFFRKYFGDDSPSGEVIGIFDNVVRADKSGVLFRCDDIDNNCQNAGWAGHWRGENATDQTVICDLSYSSRQYLSQICSLGFTVANSKNSVYWAADLLHRVWHTDKLGQGIVGHYADTCKECLDLAKSNSSEAVRNSATLRYYALDVYAYDIAVPGKGCTGKSDHSDSKDSNSETATKSDSNGGTECHTHSDGETHCV